MSQSLKFLGAFVRNPRAIGAVLPTSGPGLRAVAREIDGSVRRVIVEYGPGTGDLARMLLEPGRLTLDSKVILIERTQELASRLQATITDPRARVICDSAENVRTILAAEGESHADYVLTSIPLSVMPHEVRDHILRETAAVLGPQGACIVFLYRRVVERMLKPFFKDVQTRFVPWNVPPLRIFIARSA